MRGIDGPRLFLWVLLAGSAAMLVLLGVRHRTLRESFHEHRRTDMRVQRGQYVPSFKGITAAADESLTVGQGPVGSRQVLIFLTSTCPYCRQTLPFWKRMAGQLADSITAGSPVRILALTTDSLTVAKEYARINQLPFPLVPLEGMRLVSMYRAFVVPQTIVIDHEGRVLLARHGVIETQQALDSVIKAAVNAKPESASGQAAADAANEWVPSFGELVPNGD